MHSTQIGEINNPRGYTKRKFEILVSQTGTSIAEAGAISKGVLKGIGKKNAGNNVGQLAAFVELFQMGPRTGNPVYNFRYPDAIAYQIYEKCSSGNVSGLVSIRETAKYPVVSGEIVKIMGYCLEKKTKPVKKEI